MAVMYANLENFEVYLNVPVSLYKMGLFDDFELIILQELKYSNKLWKFKYHRIAKFDNNIDLRKIAILR